MSNRAKEIAAIMAEHEPGQVWQHCLIGSAYWHELDGEPKWAWDVNNYRRKPEPKTRPMCPNEWPPVGTPVRAFKSNKISLIVTKYHNKEALIIHADGLRTVNELAFGYEFSTDGEKTWLPFTVTEQA